DLVIDGKVSKVIITYKDRLSRVGFDLFKHLFAKYHTEIIVMSELNDKKTDQQEIFEEIISLLHAFSMRMYSSRRKKIKEALEEKGGENNGWKQKSKKATLQAFKNIRAKKTEIQYEYLVEKHVIRANDSRYLTLDKYAHLDNNIYNQALYRFRQSLFKGKWLSYGALDKSFKQSYQQKDCMLYRSMKSVHLAQQVLKLVIQNMTSWNKA